MRKELISKKALIIFLVFAFILRIILAWRYPISSDACWHANIARFIGTEWRVPFEENLGRDVFWSPFLFHIIAGFLYSILSQLSVAAAMLSIKLLPVIFSLGIILLTFLITRELLPEKYAYITTLFVAFIPHLINLSVTVYLETALMFFILLTVYFSLKSRFYLAAASLGFAAFTKYSGFAIAPFFIYALWNKSKMEFLKKIIISIFIILLISSPVLVRNTLFLDNPFWPFFKEIFGGAERDSDIKLLNASSSNLLQLPEAISIVYLLFFGVPNGRFSNLYYLNLPYIKFFIFIWLLVTLIFVLPLILGLINLKVLKKNLPFILLWAIPFLVLPFIYLLDTGVVNDVGRYAVPAYPALAIIFSIGLMSKQMSKFAKLYFILFIIIIFAFSAQEAIKTAVAHNAWKIYDDDYEKISKLVPKDAKFYANGQCSAYYINHFVWQIPDKDFKPEKESYIFINQNHKTDNVKVSNDSLQIAQKQIKMFENKLTESKLYLVE